MDAGRREAIRSLTAPEPGRVDAVLAAASPELSRARIQRLLADGLVSVNGLTARKSVRVAAGDRIEYTVPETEHEAPAEAPDLPVLFEDECFVAVDKPAGLVTHGAPGDTAASVAGWFLSRYEDAARAFDAERPGIVHRLDKDTSGVLLLAKTPAAQAHASHSFEERETTKIYLAVVEGVPDRREAVIDAPVGRHPTDRTRMAVVRRGRESRTGYEVIAEDGRRSLLRVRLYTGRTHQVRVHLAAVGIPVASDRVYGSGGEGRQLLHAWRLAIPHPDGGELEITSGIPEDFAAAVREIAGDAVAFEYSQAGATLRPGPGEQPTP